MKKEKTKELLEDILNHLLDNSAGSCYKAGCTCEGNDDSKALADRIENAIEELKKK